MVNDEDALLTVVLPLRDRPAYTEFFLRHAIHPQYRYLVLDGSVADDTASLFSAESRPNIEYIRYSPDLEFIDYIAKVGDGCRRVTTPYLVMIDNDDLLVPEGVEIALNALLADPQASLAGGDLVGFCHPGPKSNRSSWPIRLTATKDLDLDDRREAIRRNRLGYRPIWNLVSRTSDFQHAWAAIEASSVIEPHLIEFLLSDLMLAAGRFRWQRIPHYLRLENQHQRAIHDLQQSEEMTIGSRSWWTQGDELQEIVAAALDITSEDLPDLRSRWGLLTQGTSFPGPLGLQVRRLRTLLARTTALPLSGVEWLAARGFVLSLPLYRPEG